MLLPKLSVLKSDSASRGPRKQRPAATRTLTGVSWGRRSAVATAAMGFPQRPLDFFQECVEAREAMRLGLVVYRRLFDNHLSYVKRVYGRSYKKIKRHSSSEACGGYCRRNTAFEGLSPRRRNGFLAGVETGSGFFVFPEPFETPCFIPSDPWLCCLPLYRLFL